MKPQFTYNATVLKVVDGDTIVLNIDLGFYTFTTQHVRLRHINAPEMSTQAGKNAKQFLADLLTDSQVVVKTEKKAGDKYGRWLGVIYYYDTDINQLMIDQGHAVGYEGGKK